MYYQGPVMEPIVPKPAPKPSEVTLASPPLQNTYTPIVQGVPSTPLATGDTQASAEAIRESLLGPGRHITSNKGVVPYGGILTPYSQAKRYDDPSLGFDVFRDNEKMYADAQYASYKQIASIILIFVTVLLVAIYVVKRIVNKSSIGDAEDGSARQMSDGWIKLLESQGFLTIVENSHLLEFSSPLGNDDIIHVRVQNHPVQVVYGFIKLENNKTIISQKVNYKEDITDTEKSKVIEYIIADLYFKHPKQKT